MNCVLPPRRVLLTSQGHVKACALLLIVCAVGCQREEIQVYTAPKDKQSTPSTAAVTQIAKSRPQLTWTLPKDWNETRPGQMSVASFSIKGPNGTEADVSITPLMRLAGRDVELVNMWRETVGLEPLSREEAAKQLQPVEVAGESGNLFEVSGTARESSSPARIVTAMVHRPDASWFYKLTGDAALVEAQKPVFIAFLKSIRIQEGAPSAETQAASAPKPKWTVPSQWRELAPGDMQIAKFAVPARASAKAEVFVSVFPNDTGGTLANVNRWRRQIGLPEAQAADLPSMVSPLDPSNPEAILVDMKSDSKRVLGAIVPRRGSYWFYKLLGDAEAVSPEKESFVAFVKSTP